MDDHPQTPQVKIGVERERKDGRVAKGLGVNPRWQAIQPDICVLFFNEVQSSCCILSVLAFNQHSLTFFIMH